MREPNFTKQIVFQRQTQAKSLASRERFQQLFAKFKWPLQGTRRRSEHTNMRMMLNVKFQTETFNAAVRDGTAGAKLMKIVDAIKPEAIYFVEQGRTRGATIVVDMPDASKLPALVE